MTPEQEMESRAMSYAEDGPEEPEAPTFAEALARLGRVFAALRESAERHDA